MNINLIKTSEAEGAVFVKYRLHTRPPGPEYNVTLPFHVKEDGMVEFKISQEALSDLVNLMASW
jgi:hypothetical protein